MLKRENDFEKNDSLEEMKNKYNLEELFDAIVLNKEEDTTEKEKENKEIKE